MAIATRLLAGTPLMVFGQQFKYLIKKDMKKYFLF
jgi:hypothetical protein